MEGLESIVWSKITSNESYNFHLFGLRFLIEITFKKGEYSEVRKMAE